MRAAAIQMNSGEDVDANLLLAAKLMRDAADDGCRLLALPENFALMAARVRQKADIAEQPGRGPLQDWLSAQASKLESWIVAGSLPLVSPAIDERRVYGACAVFDPQGTQVALYRKIHLFDVDLADKAESYRESRSMYPGDEVVSADLGFGRLGLTICYDLRFPELFRRLVDDGCTLFTVPAAFTATTGAAHWRPLLRARAIENLAWVIAPGQVGLHPDNRETWGHSMIVDPWGRVLAELPAGNGFAAADVDPELVTRLRSEFPALTNRQLT